jgi:hypothetical protein
MAISQALPPGIQTGGSTPSISNEVLAQFTGVLTSITARLDKIENKLCSDNTAQGPTPMPPISIPPVQRHASLTPSLADLKADRVLVTQAQQLVDDVAFSGSGTDNYNTQHLKRGLFRSGGDIAPSRRVPWPQDFIAGAGMTSKLMYKDLSIFQWLEGYACIIEKETDVNLTRLMLSHFRALMRDAQANGWEAIRNAHGVVLDSIERGEFDWSDEVKVAECRISMMTNQLSSGVRQQHFGEFRDSRASQHNFQFGSGASSHASGRAQRPSIKACDFHNKGVCSHRADHRNGNVYWRHVCRACSAADHVEKDCGFLLNISQTL